MDARRNKGTFRFRHVLWNSLGMAFLVLGLVGMVTPLLPSTGFFILASGMFIKTNAPLYRWLHRNRFTGSYLRVYTEGQGLSRRSKAWTIGSLWASLVLSAWFVRDHALVLAALALVGLGVTWHVAAIRPRRISEARLEAHRRVMAGDLQGDRLAG